MDEQVMVPQAAPSSDSGSLSLRGMADVFYKPTAFFKELVQRPKILVPYIAIGLLLTVFLYLTRDLVWEMVSQSPKFMERMQNSPIAPETMHKFFGYQYVIGGLVAMLCAPLLAALLALFWGNFVFAGKAGFKQLLSIVLYGELIYAVGAIVNLGLILARGNLAANFSLGVLVASQGLDSVAYVALSKISVFLIWEIVAIGVGLSVLYNTKPSRGYLISVLSVGTLSLLHIVFTAVGKMF